MIIGVTARTSLLIVYLIHVELMERFDTLFVSHFDMQEFQIRSLLSQANHL
jgi:hypothetical protein